MTVYMLWVSVYMLWVTCRYRKRLESGLAHISHQAPSRGRRDAVVLGRTDCETLKA